jgi:hypothetical protein
VVLDTSAPESVTEAKISASFETWPAGFVA